MLTFVTGNIFFVKAWTVTLIFFNLPPILLGRLIAKTIPFSICSLLVIFKKVKQNMQNEEDLSNLSHRKSGGKIQNLHKEN